MQASQRDIITDDSYKDGSIPKRGLVHDGKNVNEAICLLQLRAKYREELQDTILGLGRGNY